MQAAGRTGGTSDTIAEGAAALLLVGAMVFGGGPKGVGDFVVELLALPVLMLAVLRWRRVVSDTLPRLFVWWWCAALALVALQLLPLPARLFAELPQRAGLLADLGAAGLQSHWLPMSLDAWGTIRGGLALAVFGAMTLLAGTLSPAARRRLLLLALLMAVPMALLGFAQAAAGTHSQLRFFAYHHPIGAIGQFANRNHFAQLQAMLLPFALAFAVQAQRRRRMAWAACWYALAVGMLLAAALSFSRAGMALSVVGVVATALLLRPAGGHGRWAPMLALGVLALGVATYAWSGIATRLAQDPADDLRWQYLHYGLTAARAYLPWGAGLGAFRTVYAPFEPVDVMQRAFADRAHDDLLQTGIEAGIPGWLLVAALLALLAVAMVRKFRLPRSPGTGYHALGVAACIAVSLPLLHSLVDYPLRTLAIAVVWGLMVSCVLAGRPQGSQEGQHALR